MEKPLFPLLMVLLISAALQVCHAQTKWPVERYSDRYSMKKISNYLKDDVGKGGHYLLAFNSTSFLNRNFAGNILDKSLKKEFGFLFGIRNYALSPLILDAGYGFDFFSVAENSASSFAGKHLSHQGLDGCVSIILFPCPKYLIPYAGLGYSHSWIKEFTTENTVEAEKSTSMATVSSPVWKAGIQSFLSDNFSVYAEYKQGFLSDKPFNKFSIGIGFNL
jgi:opacity protein-like surface antigen